jgi:hypothetical protein
MVEPEDGGTKFTFEVEYTLNLPMLRKLAESFLVKVNDQEAETLMANVKAKMET